MRAVRLILALAVGCGGDGRKAPTTPPAVAATDGGVAIIDAAPAPAVTAAEPRIAPHTGFVSAVVMDRTATAAVSVDLLGAVRLWRTLDGTAPPVAVPQRGARALDVVRAGAGVTVGAIDGSGAAHLFRFAASGGLIDAVDVPATPQAIGLVASAADAWLVVRADQSIALADAGGAIVDEVSRDGTRIEALRPSGASDALAIVSRQGDGGRTFATVPIAVVDRRLRWGTERALAIAPLTPIELAVAPDGAHLAYFADPAVVRAAAERGPRAPSQPRPDRQDEAKPRPVGPVSTAVAVVIDAATGADVTPKALAAMTLRDPQRLGFPSAATIDVFTQSSGDWTSALAADADLVTSTLGRHAAPAVGPGRVVAGVGHNLLVADDGGAARYLGYVFATATAAGLSPDGTRAAWAMATGGLLIEPLDGSASVVSALAVGVVMVEFIDDAHLLAVTGAGEAVLLDAADGRELARAPVPGSPHGSAWHPRGYLIGLRNGGVWALPVAPGQPRVFGKPTVLADGSTGFWPVDGASDDAPALVTVDPSNNVRAYTGAQLATGVPVTKLGGVPARTLLAAPAHVDRAGRVYAFDGRVVTRFASVAANDPHTFAFGPALEHIATVPATDTTIIADPAGTTTALANDGHVRWSVSLGARLTHLIVTRDGGRALLLSDAGAVVIDPATGATVAARCGWRFGAWPTAPELVNMQVESACQ